MKRSCWVLLILLSSRCHDGVSDAKKPRPNTNDDTKRQERIAKLKQLDAIVFPTRIPRDIVDGIYGAVGNVLTGSIIGMATTSLMIVSSYSESSPDISNNSTSSLATHVARGAVVGLAIATCGWCHGISHLLRGIFQTPLAVWSVWNGLRWEGNEWVVYSIPEQLERLQTTMTINVKDTTYYDILAVPMNATSKDIKRAYYEQAKHLHPDKRSSSSSSSSEQEEDFLKLHEAYYTLKDDDRRSAYNAMGESEKRFRMPVFCTIVFGSYNVEHYTGQLTITSILTLLEDLHRSKPHMFDWIQLLRTETELQARKRQLEVAQHLLIITQGFEDGTMTEEEFRRFCVDQANSIADSSPFGSKFLKSIALALQRTARFHQGNWFDSILFAPWRWINSMEMTLRYNKLAVHSFFAIRLIFRRASKYNDITDPPVDGQGCNENDQRRGTRLHVTGELIAELLPDLMKTIWVQVEYDVMQTVSMACENALDDVTSDSARVARAMVMLGDAFSKVANNVCDDDSPITMERVEVAYRIAQKKDDDYATSFDETERLIRQASAS